MAKVLIVGAGQLGSRHLQSLACLGKQSEIYVVDPSQESLEVAKSRYGQVSNGESPANNIYQTGYENIPNDIDVCIVATGAAHRLMVVKEITERFRIRFLVLEKVLFQNTEELHHAQHLLNDSQIPTWVNCPRRMFSVYQTLKERVNGSRKLKLEVEGAGWGMACNSIHFIDLWAFLSKQNGYTINLAMLENEIFPSKRLGYSEVYGSISGGVNESAFNLTCKQLQDKAPAVPLILTIETDEFLIKVNETEQVMEVLDLNGNQQGLPVTFDIKFQSELSSEVVEALLKNGECDLTPFNESAQLHSPFLDAMLEFFNQHSNIALDKCPIT